MITLENERTTSHPLGPLLFLRWFGIKQKLERCPVPSLSPVDEDNILLLLSKEPKCRLQGTDWTASQELFTHLSLVFWDLQ